MRKDQIERLKDLSERVAEVFITETDPDNWTGAGLPLSEMDNLTRGNRLWEKKNAVQTGALLARVLDLTTRDQRAGGGEKVPDHETEGELKRFEKQAKELVSAIQDRVTGATGKR